MGFGRLRPTIRGASARLKWELVAGEFSARFKRNVSRVKALVRLYKSLSPKGSGQERGKKRESSATGGRQPAKAHCPSSFGLWVASQTEDR